jgi:parallel beta-helix repeat protein
MSNRIFAALALALLTGCSSGETAAPGPVPSGPPSVAIGEWADAAGACPSGQPRVELKGVSDLQNASRGEGSFAGDAPNTCYFIRNGTYRQSGGTLLLYVLKGGSASSRRLFVGESRAGVVLVGRVTVENGVGDVTLSNLTVSLTGYTQGGTYNTVTLGKGQNVTLDHVTITGDCKTGARGGHLEVNGTRNLLVEAALIENFGRCGGGGHEDHGIYLASGRDITIRNNVIRGNASRGIQLYTGEGDYGTLNNVLIERNRIYENGHGDYEDGIVVNGRNTGTIDGLVIRRNLIYRNYYSGIRFAGPATRGVQVVQNTFHGNGAGSSSGSRSELNVDDEGMAAGSVVEQNIFSIANTLINDCYDGSRLGFAVRNNVVNGSVPGGGAGSCLSNMIRADPMFVDAGTADFRTRNAAVTAYGAYAQ